MTDHPPAAQAAIQEGERIAAADEYFKARTWIMDTNDSRRIFEAGFDRAYALLSKLRAPVADIPRAVFALEHIAAWAGSRSSLKTHKDVRAYAKHNAALASAPAADGAVGLSLEAQEHGNRRYEQGFAAGWGQCVASAPVADEREMSLVVALHFADFPRPYHTLEAPADTNGELYRALAVLAREYRSAQASAPVAGEAQPAAWKTGNGIRPTVDHRVAEVWRKQGWKVTPLYDHAAPQASDAVGLIGIDLAANGIAQVRRDTLLSVLGVLNSNPYNLTKSECVDLVHGMFAKADAALSAQPGTQKDGGAVYG